MGGRHILWLLLVLLLLTFAVPSEGATVSLNWTIEYANYTRLCYTKPLVTVNGLYPGPIINVTEGDTLVINVTNQVVYGITIHWHGIRQFRSAWADGPGNITQCPIGTGGSYVYRFNVTDQRGTLFWHAHVSWLRATVYGAFIIQPIASPIYPFPTPSMEIPLIFGEWWNANPEDVIREALATGGPYATADALTINGQPGSFYNCSQEEAPTFQVTPGDTILLRLVNALVNFDVFFTVVNHTLTVVEADAEYTKPFNTNVVVVSAGQTTNVLLTANQTVARYFMSASVYSPAPLNFTRTPTAAILSYEGANSSSIMTLPVFPESNDTAYEANFTDSLKSLLQPTNLPQTVDENLLFTVGYAIQPCPAGQTCLNSSFGGHLSASVSNITFLTPNVSLLQAYYNNISGVYTTDFPDVPLFQYDYTGVNPDNKASILGTRVKVFNYNTTVQLVLQDTATLGPESHPIHLHGHNFYVVGTGLGNFDTAADTPNFNLFDPPSRNTIAVPAGGWAAVRFTADNPGVWYMHCHFDIHVEWGMSMAFLTKDGPGADEKLLPPPNDLPPCS